MAALARTGTPEGVWLRAERQSAGRGRLGRPWVSPPGNFHGSTLVRLRPADPPAATLALVAGVAVEEAVAVFARPAAPRAHAASWSPDQVRDDRRGGSGSSPSPGDIRLKWPNDLLAGDAKLAGMLLERVDDAVVVGIGVNLAHHPDLPDRRSTSLAAIVGSAPDPARFAEALADGFARWLERWRGEGLAPVRARWIGRAHPPGTALVARLPDGAAVEGLFEGLDADGALILRLASGERRVIHAGDVFLL